MSDVISPEDLDKYGGVNLKFTNYYKFMFYFKGTAADGTELTAGYGGNTDYIYKFDVSASDTYTLSSLEWDYFSKENRGN